MEQINKIVEIALQQIAAIKELHEIDQVRSVYLGKKGQLTDIMKELSKLDAAERPKFGQAVNQAKNAISEALTAKLDALKNLALAQCLAQEQIDITLPGRGQEVGSLHPVTQTRYQLQQIFSSMGFEVIEGPEIDNEYYNFTALNIPQNHPARDSHDTFYFKDGTLLRTHTSPMQIRAMQNLGAPLRIFIPGRVYRCDSDATHSPMFNQFELLVVDEKVNFSNLKALLIKFIESFFNEKVEMRLRPSFFPFTEPSAEVDIKWKTTEGDRWLEVLGCGMVHPNVLRYGGIDPEKYTGFAVGGGIDRFAMLKYGINDIRLLFENDWEFLRQF